MFGNKMKILQIGTWILVVGVSFGAGLLAREDYCWGHDDRDIDFELVALELNEIGNMLTDYKPTNHLYDSKKKLYLLSKLEHYVVQEYLYQLGYLSLGAMQDPDPKVRGECVRVLSSIIHGPVNRSKEMIRNFIDKESDPDVKMMKEKFLESFEGKGID